MVNVMRVGIYIDSANEPKVVLYILGHGIFNIYGPNCYSEGNIRASYDYLLSTPRSSFSVSKFFSWYPHLTKDDFTWHPTIEDAIDTYKILGIIK